MSDTSTHLSVAGTMKPYPRPSNIPPLRQQEIKTVIVLDREVDWELEEDLHPILWNRTRQILGAPLTIRPRRK